MINAKEVKTKFANMENDSALGEALYNAVENIETYDMLGCNIRNVLLNTQSEEEFIAAIRMLEAIANISINGFLQELEWINKEYYPLYIKE